MRISNFLKTFVVISSCLLWWHCCFCDSTLIKHDVGAQKNKGTSAELHSGPNHEPQSKNTKENLKVVNNGNQVKETVQKDTHSKENIVHSVKTRKTESKETRSSEQPDNVETKTKSHSHEKPDVLQSHHENSESSQKVKPVSAETKHETATSPEDAKLPSLKQNLSTSKISTASKHVAADKAQVNSIPQSESLMLEESITPPLSSSVPDHRAERHEPVLPSLQHAAESQAKAKMADASVVDETEADSVLHHQHPHSEAMPSFDEWKRMMLAEQEKEGLKIPSVPPGKKIASQKRKRNYASYECGAKIVGSNSEAEGTSRILNELVDEYMLNPCKAKIWFVIELCETVQALQIELANFELFSSCPKDFAVYSSDHYPSRDWLLLGTFTAAEQRVLQSFELKQEGFGKFIKVELQSYYGKEHYCPLSVVRIYGTSMVDEYEEMETAGNIQSVSEDDEDRLDVEFNVEDVSPGNLFGSAKDAVLSMVKKAAQVLVRDQPAEGDSMNLTEHQNMSDEEVCKLFPDSSDSCSSINGTKEDSSVADLVSDVLIPYSSFHRVLFRYLRNCESCIVPSEDGNMTSAQPTCRFFQAALGPVLFKGICELFREKPLPGVMPGRPVSDVHVLQKDSTKTSPKHSTSISPPPQIISVIIDGAVESKSLPAYSDSIPPSPVPHPDTSASALLEELSSFPAPKIEEGPVNHVKVESIQPTKAFQDDIKEEELGLSSSLAEVSPPKASDEVLESSVIDAVVQPSITDLKFTSTPTEHTTLPSAGQSSVSSDSPSVVSGDVTPLSDASGFTISEKPLETPLEESGNDTVVKMSTVKYEDPASLTEPAAFTPEDFSEAFPSQPSGLSDKEDKDGVLMGSVLSTAGGQKESVFMRMSNRIKALELNMSLSSQYLQELSQRYRRQMEEMQRAFNRTIGTLNDTARKAAERDVKQQEVISGLQAQVANLTHSVDLLIAERNILFTKMVETHIFLMIVEAIVMITILSLCARRISSSSSNFHYDSTAVEKAVVPYQQNIVKRRNSADSPHLPDVTVKIRKRSCSEEALRGDVVIIEPAQIKVEPLPKVKKKTRKKNKGLRRSASNPSLVAKNSKYSPMLKSDESKEELCTAGVLFSASKSGRSPSTKPTGKDSGVSYCDENCNMNCPKQMPGANCNKGQEKARRIQSAPLQNLTNGVVNHSLSHSGHSDKTTESSEARNLGLKKFLKLQKRDSV